MTNTALNVLPTPGVCKPKLCCTSCCECMEVSQSQAVCPEHCVQPSTVAILCATSLNKAGDAVPFLGSVSKLAARGLAKFAAHNYSSSATLTHTNNKSKRPREKSTKYCISKSQMSSGIPPCNSTNSLTNLQSWGDQSLSMASEVAIGLLPDRIPACRPGQGGARSTNHRENCAKVADKKRKLITQITSTAQGQGVAGLFLHDSGVHSHESK